LKRVQEQMADMKKKRRDLKTVLGNNRESARLEREIGSQRVFLSWTESF
jgi:hypothetical protein